MDSGSHRLRLGFSGHPRPTAVVAPLLPHLSDVAEGGGNVDTYCKAGPFHRSAPPLLSWYCRMGVAR